MTGNRLAPAGSRVTVGRSCCSSHDKESIVARSNPIQTNSTTIPNKPGIEPSQTYIWSSASCSGQEDVSSCHRQLPEVSFSPWTIDPTTPSPSLGKCRHQPASSASRIFPFRSNDTDPVYRSLVPRQTYHQAIRQPPLPHHSPLQHLWVHYLVFQVTHIQPRPTRLDLMENHCTSRGVRQIGRQGLVG